ncbi:hypothetical protein NG891_14455 [Enterococcus gallinarum]|uniref:hypothetical protein n=1 Tax=Enterococcus gallinarum TaxID=1353 RepID=UPI0020913815|nr:hypothetical protein [Enterococcus gallinarum]MCO5477947.1 hypothetical protein [Enterococcus gallinarum]
MSQVAYGIVLFCTCLFVWGMYRLLGCCINWLTYHICTLLEQRQKRVDANKKRLS